MPRTWYKTLLNALKVSSQHYPHHASHHIRNHVELGSFVVPSPGLTLQHPVSQWSEGVQGDFFNRGGLPEDWVVTVVEHCKQKDGKRHEYLRFTLEHCHNYHVLFLYADCTPAEALGAKHVSSSSSMKAHDRIRIAYTPSISDESMITLSDFPPASRFTSLELSLLLEATSNLKPDYKLYNSQCYWFCAVVWNVIKKQFGGVEERNHAVRDDRCTYCTDSFVGNGDLRRSVKSICRTYRKSREEFENQVQIFECVVGHGKETQRLSTREN
ncbi:hypothetical protein JAAARDRAFT_48482 [Jaapia argillacea MUCL 33604]|uniref:Uncharacterized protein n=1 Tax=Jaapia argillacea MUCL 33604 TaxID=933084 RepID=A0A067PQS6_9AGAM|nr:hypothetical protein JAAARDRAFT_48482 [Jaapia argillacea MUCL 33604]